MNRIVVLCLFIALNAFGDWKDLKKDLRKTLREKNSLNVIKTLEKCKEFDQPETADFLISLVKASRTPRIYKITSSRVLASFKNENVRKLLEKSIKTGKINLQLLQAAISPLDETSKRICEGLILRSSDPQELTLVIRKLGHFKTCKAEVHKILYAKLAEKQGSTSVKRSVVEALGGLADSKSAPLLINLMKDKLLGSLAIDSLQRLTGQKIGNSPTEWRKWLAQNKDFKSVNTPLNEFLAEKAKLAEAEMAKAEKVDSAEFYGVEIKGQRILFVLDRSGSMSAKTDYGNRLDQLKKEFGEMLDTIGYKVSIGILWFAGNDTYPPSGVEEVNDSFRDRIKKHMKKVQPMGGTPIGEAMEYAFKKIIEKREIDTIYLLSDGSPNTPSEQVRAIIKELNSSHFIKINTISIGAESEFLKDVAADNYGTYTEIK